MAVLMLSVALPSDGTWFYAAPAGSSSGDGSLANPWDLQTALNQPAGLNPGDTVWLRGGVYRVANRPTKFVSHLAGAPNQPVTLRQYPGERATIDGNILQTTGGWVNYWGFEIMDSQQFGGGNPPPNRVSPQSGPFPTTWYANYDGATNDFTVSGMDLHAPNVKLINLVVHDNIGGGIGVDIAAGTTEIYGSLSYYNGWQGADRGHGHGIYAQNQAPTVKHVGDCLMFDNFALGMQATGTGPAPVADNMDIEGNAFFLNGALSSSHQANLFIGPVQGVGENPVVLTNFIYDTMGSGSDFTLGNTDNAIVEGNYFQTSATFGANTFLTLQGNAFLGGTIGLDQAGSPHNNYSTVPPSTNVVFVRPNKYEPGRANIVIYNWQNLNSVAVDVSQVLPAGVPFEVRNALDFFAPPVLTGTNSGAPLNLPMTGLTVAQPVGIGAPPASGPAFNAFVLLPLPGMTLVNAGLPGVVDGAATWGDCDNDGKLDILLTGIDANGNPLSQIRRNLGNGVFTNVNAGLPGVGNSSAAWGDYDNDGRLDILLTGQSSAGLISQVWRNLGNGVFTNINAGLPGVFSGSVAWGDYDNDGKLDILLTGSDGTNGISQVWRNLGNGVFTNINAGLPGVYHSSVAWGDFDNDGNLDILLAGESSLGPVCQIWRNLGNGTFTNINAALPGLVAASVAWGDYDNDGNLDLLLTGESSAGPVCQIWRNLGNGIFANINAGLPEISNGSVAWGDYDNDGRLDLLLTGIDAGGDSISQIWRNLGNGVFTNINVTLPPMDKGSVAWGDYDNDGRLDVLLTGESGSAPGSQLWRNNFSVANSVPSAPGGLAASVKGMGALLGWNRANDAQTPAPGLTYNVRVGATPGGSEIVAPQAGVSLRHLPQLGNAQERLAAMLTNLTAGRTYYWSVQAIDTAFASSPFAPEKSFTVGAPGTIGFVRQADGRFQLQFNGMAGMIYTLQASTNLAQWITLASLTPGSNGLVQFTDPQAASFPMRFYRVALINPATGARIGALTWNINGAVSFQITGIDGQTYVIQASTNLVDWADLGTNVTSGGIVNFTDPNATNFPARFYRVKTQ